MAYADLDYRDLRGSPEARETIMANGGHPDPKAPKKATKGGKAATKTKRPTSGPRKPKAQS